MMRYRSYTNLVVALIVGVTLTIGCLNYIVDPYGKNNVFSNSFNKFKIIRDERISKFDLLISNPDASSFIFGSSRGLILNPEVVENIKGGKALNLAFSSATAEEYYLYIKYIFETREVENIIIGIDLFAYAEGFDSTGTLPQALRDYFEMDSEYSITNYLSFRMFKRTIKAVKYNLSHTVADIDDKYTDKGKVIIREYVESLSNADKFEYYVNEHVVKRPGRWATRYDGLDQSRLDSLIKIKRLCRYNGVPLYLFTSPLYIKQITVKQNKFFLQEKLLSYIVRNIGAVLDMNTIEQVNNNPEFYIDEFHYSYVFADSILTQLLTGKPLDKKYQGEFVDKADLESHVKKVNDRLVNIGVNH